MENKKPQKQQKMKPIKPFKPKTRVFSLNLTNIIFIVAIIFIGYFIISSFNQPSLGEEVTFNEFTNSTLENKFSQIDIRDDGKAIGYDKYVHQILLDGEDTFGDVDAPEGTDVVSNIESISIEEFIHRTRKPSNPQEIIDSIRGNFDNFTASELIIGEKFILAKQAAQDGGDLIIQDITYDQFTDNLEEADRTVSDIAPNITFLKSAGDTKSLSEFNSIKQNSIYSDIWVISNDQVFARVKNEEVNRFFTLLAPLDTDFLTYLQTEGFDAASGNIEINSVSIPIVPWGDIITLAVLIGVGFLVFTMFRGIQGSGNSLMKFGQSKAGVFFGKKPEVTFDDVAGVDEAKEELKEVVMFLKSPQKFLKLGARIPKGLLLVGQPGTGKTLLARAIAGEAGVPFFHTSGSEFEEMLVGAGASRVRDLFEKAKKASPAIIFIDEIDAVARKRGTTIQSSSTEQTLNQILVEMDGFEKKDNVIVIAATNRPDVLDPAILRPGRFDRRVVLDLPDIEGRKQIIGIHASNKPLAEDVNIEKIAKRTVGFSGADIENMLNEAAIITAKAGRSKITEHDLEEAATKVSIGPERKRKRDKEELEMTAYHEAGHAIIAKLVPKSDPVHRITIISRGMSLGSTMQLPQIDKVQQTKQELESRIKVLLGGRAAEELIFKDITGGASNDIEKATSIARKMVKLLGMSKALGLVKYGQSNELQYLGYGYGEQRDYSEKTAELIDDEVRVIMQESYKEVEDLLKKNIEILHKVSKQLLEKEVIEADEFEKFFSSKLIK
ncbi:MAG TPA: ATP-dependent zinc metalloprotease FtsH [Candidatus Dojkabacteria bacterium]